MRALLTLFALLIAGTTALADEVVLRNGHRVVGIQTEEKDRIVVETGFGTVSYPRSEVVSVTKGETPLHAWPVRYAEIEKSDSAVDFTKLAAWARENRMPKYVGRLMIRAIELDPDNAEARAELGYVRLEGRWVHRSEVRKQQGDVQEGGRWMSKLEKELEERRRIDAESRKLDRESVRKQRDESRRRAREEAQLQARIKAAQDVPPAYDGPYWRRGWGYGGWGSNWGWDYWGVNELIAVDWLIGFVNGGGFPITRGVGRPPMVGAPDLPHGVPAGP